MIVWLHRTGSARAERGPAIDRWRSTRKLTAALGLEARRPTLSSSRRCWRWPRLECLIGILDPLRDQIEAVALGRREWASRPPGDHAEHEVIDILSLSPCSRYAEPRRPAERGRHRSGCSVSCWRGHLRRLRRLTCAPLQTAHVNSILPRRTRRNCWSMMGRAPALAVWT